MAMYYFDFESGDTETLAIEFSSDAAAIQEARLRALDRTAHLLPEHRRACSIRVRNCRGDEIHAVRMADPLARPR
jgi:hypothetical protein